MAKKVISSWFTVHGKKKTTTNYKPITINSLGFTLAEGLISFTIAGIVGLLLTSTLIQNNNLFTNQSANINQGISSNQISNEMSELIRSANFVASQNPIGSPQYISSNQVLVLALPSINSSGEVVDSSYDYAVITKDSQNTKLLREIIFPAGSSTRKPKDQILTTRLANLAFQYLDDTDTAVAPNLATKVNFTIYQSENTGNSSVQNNISGQASLRNN